MSRRMHRNIIAIIVIVLPRFGIRRRWKTGNRFPVKLERHPTAEHGVASFCERIDVGRSSEWAHDFSHQMRRVLWGGICWGADSCNRRILRAVSLGDAEIG